MKQTMRLMTIFYNPEVMTPDTICPTANPITEESLLAGIAACLAQGGVVRISHVEAELLRLADGHTPGNDPRWVGLTFVPALPGQETTMTKEARPDA